MKSGPLRPQVDAVQRPPFAVSWGPAVVHRAIAGERAMEQIRWVPWVSWGFTGLDNLVTNMMRELGNMVEK